MERSAVGKDGSATTVEMTKVIQESVDFFASCGTRTLCFASKTVDATTYQRWNMMSQGQQDSQPSKAKANADDANAIPKLSVGGMSLAEVDMDVVDQSLEDRANDLLETGLTLNGCVAIEDKLAHGV